MVTDASGRVGDTLQLLDNSSKGKAGRTILLKMQLKQSIYDLYHSYPKLPAYDQHVIFSERGMKMMPCNISHWFKKAF
jgi:hypothetical protein